MKCLQSRRETLGKKRTTSSAVPHGTDKQQYIRSSSVNVLLEAFHYKWAPFARSIIQLLLVVNAVVAR